MTVKMNLKNQKGQILIFVALAFIMLGLLVGLAVDLGSAYLLQARLARIVDAAALAAARAMVGAEDPITAAESAACDSATVNGMDPGECPSGRVQVTVGDVQNPDLSLQQGVIVKASGTLSTSFMSLGTLIGCSTCAAIPVSAVGSAAPGLVDILLLMDDTASMRDGPPICDPGQGSPAGCPILQARTGALAFVNSLINPGSELIEIGLLPFRGCYRDTPSICVDNSKSAPTDIVPLTNNAAALVGTRGSAPGGCAGRRRDVPDNCGHNDGGTGIEGLWAQGGSNTNVCIGLVEARTLLASSGRAGAGKILVVLTDAENTAFSPTGYPQCTGGTGGATDTLTNAQASVLKAAGIEIYVLGYGIDPPGDDAAPCNVSQVSTRDRQLAKCMASSSPGTNDHYFEAATPDQIGPLFDEIAEQIKKRLRLVS